MGDTAANSLAIALGANLGDPPATLAAVRPLLAAVLESWWPGPGRPRLRWSPLFRTEPVGGPAGQPDFLNAVLLADPLPAVAADAGLALLQALQALEARFGRQRLEHWGPRSLDLDLLWCGALSLDRPELSLPHPRLRERAFVLVPLAALDPALIVPGDGVVPLASVRELLEGLPPEVLEPSPERLGRVAGWPE
ncbi:MAG: 2-amino-4-hydroxy-6-hydroxymethyldihydropteridine diphosphokinase [Cyanobium sp.]